MSTLLTRGIAAAKAGKREEARSLLAGALQRDANNEQAWLWLGAVVGNPRETLICLRRVLALNPDNRQAQEGIKWAKAKLAQSRGSSPPISPGDGDAPTSSLVTSASSAAKEVSFTQRSSETAVLPSGPASVPKRPNLRVAVVSPPGVAARGLARIGLIPLLMILLLSLALVIGLALLQWLLSP